jgi:DNA-binding NarL/FixJ family response regulator
MQAATLLIRDGLAQGAIAFIDPLALSRDCIAQSLRSAGMEVLPFASAGECVGATADADARLVLLYMHDRGVGDPEIDSEIAIIERTRPGVPLVVLSNRDDLERIRAALGRGVSGYIPASAPLRVIVEAIRLVGAGGKYVPVNVLGDLTAGGETAQPPGALAGLTPRQSAVLEELRKGRANKRIAYELSMSQSTVKAHVRTIMKKMGATNRTEAVCRAEKLLGQGI